MLCGGRWSHAYLYGWLPHRRESWRSCRSRFLQLFRIGIYHMPRASAVPFTTITMNKRYAARLHRDSRNDGPSIGNAVGKFSGGKLLYWRRFLLRNVRGSAGGSCKQEATSFHAESADHRDNVRQQTEDLWHLVKERAALEGTSVQGASRSNAILSAWRHLQHRYRRIRGHHCRRHLFLLAMQYGTLVVCLQTHPDMREVLLAASWEPQHH